MIRDPVDEVFKLKFESITSTNSSVLGKITGVFGRMNSMSVNDRFYSSDFWKKVLNSVQVKSRLSSGKMIGTLEHPMTRKKENNLGSPTLLHPYYGGMVTKKLTVQGDLIIGEAYILNTPVGQLIKSYLSAKDDNGDFLIEVHISSRGFTRKDYMKDGIDHMNPDDYFLEAFDVVITPGIPGTRIKMESEEESLDELTHKLESAIQECDSKRCITRVIVETLKLKSQVAKTAY
jgi:hypothetical protein